jgi:hypothetical protein
MDVLNEIQKKFIEKIYIVESPSNNDIANGVNEGNALNSALNLAKLNSRYFNISSQKELAKCFEDIAIDIEIIKGSKIPIPYLHFSLHGNEDGINLTNRDFIKWGDLREGLLLLNHRVKPVNLFGKIGSRFYLSMSVCKGINAKKMFLQGEQLNPFSVLVGPLVDVDWSDSLIAYTTYFHNLLYKRSKLEEAVSRMNYAVGSENLFEIFLDANLSFM